MGFASCKSGAFFINQTKIKKMDLSKINIAGFSLHTKAQKETIKDGPKSRLEGAELSHAPCFSPTFCRYGLSNEAYHKSNGFVSSSQLKKLSKTEKHFTDSSLSIFAAATLKNFALGTLIHDDLECKSETGQWVQWKAGTFKTKTTIKVESLEVHESVLKMIERYRKEFETDEILKQIIKFGDAEVSFSDEERKLKVRPDKLLRNDGKLEIIDYKSVADISKFKYDLYSYGYDISAGMYSDVIENLTGLKVGFTFVLISKKTGLTKIVEISDATLEVYKEKFRALYEHSKNINLENPKGYKLQII
jgi:hypothetical protein